MVSRGRVPELNKVQPCHSVDWWPTVWYLAGTWMALAPLIQSNRMWSDNWIDFHGQDIMCWEHRTQNAPVQLHGTVRLKAFNILVELLNYGPGQTAHFATYSLSFKRRVCVSFWKTVQNLAEKPWFQSWLTLELQNCSSDLKDGSAQWTKYVGPRAM